MPGKIIYNGKSYIASHKCDGQPYGIDVIDLGIGAIWKCDECGQEWVFDLETFDDSFYGTARWTKKEDYDNQSGE